MQLEINVTGRALAHHRQVPAEELHIAVGILTGGLVVPKNHQAHAPKRPKKDRRGGMDPPKCNPHLT